MSSAPAINLLEFKSESIINASQVEEEVKLDKSEFEEIKSEAVKENMDMTEEKDNGGDGEVEFIGKILFDKIESNDTESNKLMPKNSNSYQIKHYDIGLLNFDKDTGKTILFDVLRKEIKLDSKYFQNRNFSYQQITVQ